MHIPDRVIVKRLKEYDRHLYVKWNSEKQYFELWRHMPWGSRLVTPVTQSIYNPDAPKAYTSLDMRIIDYVKASDPFGPRGEENKKAFKNLGEHLEEKDRKLNKKYDGLGRDLAKEMWKSMKYEYVTRHPKKNSGKPDFNKARKNQKWIRPNSVGRFSRFNYMRTRQNALAYDFKK